MRLARKSTESLQMNGKFILQMAEIQNHIQNISLLLSLPLFTHKHLARYNIIIAYWIYRIQDIFEENAFQF